jgi:hypothetical protein
MSAQATNDRRPPSSAKGSIGNMNIIENLMKTKERTLPYFDLSESELNKSYAPGKWSIRYLLHHLTDAETVFYDRIRRVISEPRQVIWAFDQDAWANRLDYGRVPLHLAKSIYSSVREAIIYHAQQHYEQKGPSGVRPQRNRG